MIFTPEELDVISRALANQSDDDSLKILERIYAAQSGDGGGPVSEEPAVDSPEEVEPVAAGHPQGTEKLNQDL